MNKTPWIILTVVIIISGGIALYARQNSDNKAHNTINTIMKDEGAMQKQDAMMMEEKNSMQKEDSMTKEDAMMEEKNDSGMMKPDEGTMKNEGAMQKPDNEMMQKPGAYIDYSPTALAEASKNNGKTVLFFWASWCPFCKAANEAFISRASDIPTGVTVLKTNYDTEKELKTKYGVTYQHTFVQIDANGNQVSKWNGGDIDTLKKNIK